VTDEEKTFEEIFSTDHRCVGRPECEVCSFIDDTEVAQTFHAFDETSFFDMVEKVLSYLTENGRRYIVLTPLQDAVMGDVFREQYKGSDVDVIVSQALPSLEEPTPAEVAAAYQLDLDREAVLEEFAETVRPRVSSPEEQDMRDWIKAGRPRPPLRELIRPFKRDLTPLQKLGELADIELFVERNMQEIYSGDDTDPAVEAQATEVFNYIDGNYFTKPQGQLYDEIDGRCPPSEWGASETVDQYVARVTKALDERAWRKIPRPFSLDPWLLLAVVCIVVGFFMSLFRVS